MEPARGENSPNLSACEVRPLLRSVLTVSGGAASLLAGSDGEITCDSGLAIWAEADGALSVIKGPCAARVVDERGGPVVVIRLFRVGEAERDHRRIPVVQIRCIAPLSFHDIHAYAKLIRDERGRAQVH